MKIDNPIKTTTSGKSIAEGQPPQGRAAGAQPKPQPQPQPRDSVQITSLSSQLHALESSLSDVSVVDTARVSAIKQAISEGRFKINSEVVAGRLLNTVKELVLNQKG